MKKLVQAGREFELKANMWVFEELIEGRKLTEIINETHENVKYKINTREFLFIYRYLPGIKLPENIIAVPDLIDACKDATLLIFVVPHQVAEYFLNSLLKLSFVYF